MPSGTAPSPLFFLFRRRNFPACLSRLGQPYRDSLFTTRDFFSGFAAFQCSFLALVHRLLDLASCFWSVFSHVWNPHCEADQLIKDRSAVGRNSGGMAACVPLRERRRLLLPECAERYVHVSLGDVDDRQPRPVGRVARDVARAGRDGRSTGVQASLCSFVSWKNLPDFVGQLFAFEFTNPIRRRAHSGRLLPAVRFPPALLCPRPNRSEPVRR